MKKVMVNSIYSEIDGRKVSEVELVYKSQIKPSERPAVSDSKETYQLLKINWDGS